MRSPCFPRKLSTILLFVSCLPLVVMAQDNNVVISYQGVLTNDSGTLLDGSYDLTFGIYAVETGPPALWTETHTGVPVSSGLFTVILGSQSALPDSVFKDIPRFLGTTVGTDSEIAPRTLLTSTPFAAYAKRLSGDVVTESGAMLINTATGDSAIVLTSGIADNVVRMYMIDPGDDGKLFEIFGNTATNSSGLYLIDPGDDGHRLAVVADGETNQTGLYLIDPGDDGRLAELSGNEVTNEAGLYLIDPGDDGIIANLSSSPLGGGSLVMFNPQPEPPAKMFELLATPADGPSMMMQYSSAAMTGPPVALMADMMHARIGIGTATPSEPLVIGTDLGSLTGELIVVGNMTAGGSSGLTAGEASNNRGGLFWNNDGNYLNLGTVDAGTSNLNTLVLKNGMVGIDAAPLPGWELYVAGDIYATGEILEFSDAEAKTDVQTIGDALAIVERLRGVRYRLKEDVADSLNAGGEPQIGLLAQEVDAVLPELVRTPAEGYRSLNYTRLTAVLVEAVKELKAENESLRVRLDRLEAAR